MRKKEPLFSFVIPPPQADRESFRLVRNRKEGLRTSRNDRKRINVALLMILLLRSSVKNCHCECNEAISLFSMRLPRTFQVLAMTGTSQAYGAYRWIWELVTKEFISKTTLSVIPACLVTSATRRGENPS